MGWIKVIARSTAWLAVTALAVLLTSCFVPPWEDFQQDDDDTGSGDDDTGPGDDDTGSGDDDTQGDDDSQDDDVADDDTGDDDTSSDDDGGDDDVGDDDTSDDDTGDDDTAPIDVDGDGYSPPADCNDNNPNVNPGQPEVTCNGLDDDCNPATLDGPDGDGDGYDVCVDCDDGDPQTYPGATELCDGLDNDCDTVVPADEVDGDGDSWLICDGDCDDTNPAVHPGATEVPCDGADNDCDPQTEDDPDADGDGWGACTGDCDDSEASVNPGEQEVCNDGLDNDCDGMLFPGEVDADGDGSFLCDPVPDCDDTDPAVNPSAAEFCDDLVDNDCDGLLDCMDNDCGGSPSCPLTGFVTLGAGVFTMGSPVNEVGRNVDETEHQVTLTGSFEIGVMEVTQGQFEGVMGWNPPDTYGNSGVGTDYPVYWVSWYDVAAYADEVSLDAGLTPCYVLDDVVCEDGTSVGTSYLGCMNGTQGGIDSATVSFGGGATTPYQCEGYRLPTEAEWEYAARSAGAVTDAFPAGGNLLPGDDTNCVGNLVLDDGSVLDDQAWYCGNNNPYGSKPVGGLLANPVSLYDMSGNLWEWTHDNWNNFGGDVTDPWGPMTGTSRVLRGGYWDNGPRNVRVAVRYGGGPDSRANHLGGRLSGSIP